VKIILISKKRKGATSAHLVKRKRGRRMNREYLSAKAELCSKLAVEQINNGDNEEGVKNFKRMIRALGQIHLLDIEERRGRE
jgi:hypothetical protein